jgi:hypothetical protein
VLAALPSCLVTGSPNYDEAVPSRPFVTVVAPPVTELLRIERVGGAFPVQQFSVHVTSEDAGEQLEAALLIDYGQPRDVGSEVGLQPYQEDWSPQVIPEGSLSDEPRLVTLPWLPSLDNQNVPECHSVTMMVVRHPYGSSPYAWCPKDEQFATETWFLAVCDEPGSCNFESCPTRGDEIYAYCPNPSDLPRAGATQ